jgi:hypothetical protein
MSLFSDLFDIFNRSSNSATATANNSTNVSVNPTILNAVDLSPLASPLQNLVDAMTVGQAVELRAAQLQADAISEASQKQATTIADQFKSLATWVALGTLGVSIYKMARA